jgi:hypothetical protein
VEEAILSLDENQDAKSSSVNSNSEEFQGVGEAKEAV